MSQQITKITLAVALLLGTLATSDLSAANTCNVFTEQDPLSTPISTSRWATLSQTASAFSSSWKEKLIRFTKNKVVDHIFYRYKPFDIVDLAMPIPQNQGHLTPLRLPRFQMEVYKLLGSGMYGAIYQIQSINDAELSDKIASDSTLIAKLPHFLKTKRGNVFAIPAIANASDSELVEYNHLLRQFSDIRADSLYPADAAWTQLPVVPILKSFPTEIGTILIKPKITGLELHALYQRYGHNLPPAIIEGLRDYYNFAQALNRTVKVTVTRNGQQIQEGFSVDLRPPNLIWIEEPDMMKTLGLKRPAFISFELSQLQNNEPRYLSSHMKFEEYLRILQDYLEAEK